jgi:hypothetical protein
MSGNDSRLQLSENVSRARVGNDSISSDATMKSGGKYWRSSPLGIESPCAPSLVDATLSSTLSHSSPSRDLA